MAFPQPPVAMPKSNNNLESLFMNLPAEFRIDIYERVFNSTLDNDLLQDPLDPRLMQKAMLSTLHINQTIRSKSRPICIQLANRHIKALETLIVVNNAARLNMPNLSTFAPLRIEDPHTLSAWDSFVYLADLADKIAYDANKVNALYGFLRIMGAPREGRVYVQRSRRLHLIYRNAKREFNPIARMIYEMRIMR